MSRLNIFLIKVPSDVCIFFFFVCSVLFFFFFFSLQTPSNSSPALAGCPAVHFYSDIYLKNTVRSHRLRAQIPKWDLKDPISPLQTRLSTGVLTTWLKIRGPYNLLCGFDYFARTAQQNLNILLDFQLIIKVYH